MNNCNDKIKYREFTDAEKYLEKYRSYYLFSNMCVYRCSYHRCWHLGHDRKMSKEKIVNNTIVNFDSSIINFDSLVTNEE